MVVNVEKTNHLVNAVTSIKELGGKLDSFKTQIDEIVAYLNECSEKYYYEEAIISDKEFDAIYDNLVVLEQMTGYINPKSPTIKVGSENPEDEMSKELKKVTHSVPALSLAKTKSVDSLTELFATGEVNAEKGREGSVLAWKCDGMTLVLTYENGKLIQAVTRGNGYIGEDVTHNAPYIKGVPMSVPEKKPFIVRGEAMISFAEFNRINENLPADAEHYKNPRNLTPGTLRLMDKDEDARMRDREVQFFAFKLVRGLDEDATFAQSLDLIKAQGIQTVPYVLASASDGSLKKAIEDWSTEESLNNFGFPVDGLVVTLNDTIYAAGFPDAEKHPHPYNGYALKWQDETVETVLRDIEWSPSRTGLLNPVAIFDPVELEGTTVSRASVHNISYIMEKDLRIGDTITVYKANKIIPQVDSNISAASRDQKVKGTHLYKLINKCPVCGEVTGIHTTEDDIMTLHCNNPFCAVKNIGNIVHFCERDCMNIIGLSKSKIAFLVENGYIENRLDLFRLKNQGNGAGVEKLDKNCKTNENNILENEPGWDVKSVDNLLASIEKARTTDFVSFMHSMSIPNIGKGQSKLLLKHLQEIYDNPEYKECVPEDGSYNLFIFMTNLVSKMDYDFSMIDGFGDVLATSLKNWIKKYLVNPVNSNREVLGLLEVLTFTDVRPNKANTNSSINGKTFVITGSLLQFKNRDELVADIEANGGKVSGSVSAKTSYLINNDVTSTSGKNKKAQELGVKIISEADYIAMK